MRHLTASTAQELEARTFSVVPCGDELTEALREAYVVWGELFTSSEKFTLPGDVDAPSGYVPLCMPVGCEMKESFYLRAECAPPPRCAEATRRLVSLLSGVAVSVAAEIADAAGRPLVRIPAAGCLRVMHYPAFEGGEQSELMRMLERNGALRTAVHTDLNALTVLTPATAPGLEIRTGDEWAPPEVNGAGLLVHVGQELEARSDGRWRATEHRVRNPVGEERSRSRLSFAYFVS